MKTLKYWQLLDDCSNPLIEGNDNPANIPDNSDFEEARPLAEAWMKANGVADAVLVENESREDGYDEIVCSYDLCV